MKLLLKKHRALSKGSKKGFTLVELIVVIVILGILAAIAVPALTGYIDKARQEAAIAEAKNIETALQTILVTSYSKGATLFNGAHIDNRIRIGPGDGGATNSKNAPMTPAGVTYRSTINQLLGTHYTKENFGSTTAEQTISFTDASKTGVIPSIDKFIFVSDSGIKVQYNSKTGYSVVN